MTIRNEKKRDEKIRALVIDDEPLARRGIRQNLQSAAPDVEIVGECANGQAAVQAIKQENPDLIFLDVQMPLLDGFGVIDALGVENLPPAVVFVTAFDEYAIRAFDHAALDYLLKPIDPERFQKTLERVRGRIKTETSRSLDEKLAALLRDVESLRAKNEPPFLERLAIKEAGRVSFVNVNEITWISSEGNYVKLHAGRETYLLRETMDGIESKLDPQKFLRLRRSTIVRTEEIKELHPLFNGEFQVVLKNGVKLSSSRRYRKNLDSLIKS